MGKSQEGKQERNRRKQRGNAEEDGNLKRDRDLEKEKVESLYVTREMAEDKEMDEKIRQDLIHAADQAEKEFQKEALGAPRMKPEEKQQLFDDIVGELKKKGIWEESPEDQLSAEDREALRLGRELLNNPKKKRSAVIHKIFKGVAGAAVVAVGVFVLSMSSEANREKILGVWNSIAIEGLRIKTESGLGHNANNEQELQMAEDIKQELGFKVPQLMYVPEGLKYNKYILDKNSGMVNIFYFYKEAQITFNIYKQVNEASRNQQFDGIVIDEVKISPEEIDVYIYELESDDRKSYMARFNYNNTCYSIWGEIPKEELKKMIEKIRF